MAKYAIEGESIHELYCAIGRIVDAEIYAAKRPNAPIDVLKLKRRTRNALLANGIESVEQLKEEPNFSYIPGVGKVGAADIKECLAAWRMVNG